MTFAWYISAVLHTPRNSKLHAHSNTKTTTWPGKSDSIARTWHHHAKHFSFFFFKKIKMKAKSCENCTPSNQSSADRLLCIFTSTTKIKTNKLSPIFWHKHPRFCLRSLCLEITPPLPTWSSALHYMLGKKKQRESEKRKEKRNCCFHCLVAALRSSCLVLPDAICRLEPQVRLAFDHVPGTKDREIWTPS